MSSSSWLDQLEARLDQQLEAFLAANPSQETLLEEQGARDRQARSRLPVVEVVGYVVRVVGDVVHVGTDDDADVLDPGALQCRQDVADHRLSAERLQDFRLG